MGATTFYSLLLTATMAVLPRAPLMVDQTDLIEINHYYDKRGKLVFDQVIFWNWSHDAAAFRVVAWRFIKKPSQMARRDWRRGGFVSLWHDGHVLREVRSDFVRETWTQFDPEVRDRDQLPQHLRRGLFGENISPP